MKKRIAMLLTLVLVLGLAACGIEKAPETTAPTGDNVPASSMPGEQDPAMEEGKVFNIYAWNEEFKGFFEKYYQVPSGITVNWIITPNDGGAYKSKLDASLRAQDSLPADERIDMFLLEVDHNIMQYTNAPCTQDIQALGVTDFSNTYPYTVQAASDANGVVKGVSFQCCPSALIYRRSIALDVLGTDDPAQVQEKLANWELFSAVAAEAKAKGYYMTASESETYRTFSSNVTVPWVDNNGRLQFDEQILAWMAQAKEFSEKGYTINTGIWDPPKNDQMFADGKTLCFFGPSWYFNFCMGNAQDPERGCYGDWAICQGPQSHFWGGTWLMASASSDNPTMLADVMNTFINDEDVCFALVANEAQFSNNQAVNAKFASDPEYGNPFLGGQNDVAVFAELAKNIRFGNHTVYDQIINEQLQSNWRAFCQGTVTEEEAMANFCKAIKEIYPAIVMP